MARDDYFVIVYKILTYLYECLKTGKNIDTYNILIAETYGIEESYFNYILIQLYEEGYIEGINIIPIMGSKQKNIKITSNIMIKPKGIEYLQENSMLSKAKGILKEIKDTIPRFIRRKKDMNIFNINFKLL